MNTPSFNKKLLSQTFGRAAQSYDDVAVLQREVNTRLLEQLELITLQPNTIIDLGASTGTSTLGLTQYYPDARIYGVDIAHGMIHRAHQQCTHPNIDYITADADHLPFADNSVEFVFSNLMLQWCSDLETVFSEIHRVLTPEGLVFFSTLGPDTLYELRESWAQVDDKVHVNNFIDMHNVGDAMVQARLLDPVMNMEKITLFYASVTNLMRDLKAIGAHNINAERHKQLTGKQKITDMHNAYEKFKDDQDYYPATYEVIYWGLEV